MVPRKPVIFDHHPAFACWWRFSNLHLPAPLLYRGPFLFLPMRKHYTLDNPAQKKQLAIGMRGQKRYGDDFFDNCPSVIWPHYHAQSHLLNKIAGGRTRICLSPDENDGFEPTELLAPVRSPEPPPVAAVRIPRPLPAAESRPFAGHA